MSNSPPKDLSDQALAWIVRLHSGEAARSDRAAFRAWRAQSAAHEAAAAEAEALWSDASDLHRDPATGLIGPGRRASRRMSRRKLIVGAAAVGVAGAGGVAASRRPWRALQFDHVTGLAETRVVALPDGSEVTLNARSAMNVAYSAQERRVSLAEGQAYFEVRRDSGRPFAVDIRGHVVTALGTAFDIDSNLPDGEIAIVVIERSVRIAPTPNVVPPRTLEVGAGDRIVIGADSVLRATPMRDATIASAWRTGMYIAEGRPLAEVIEAFRPYHAGFIVIRDGRLKSLKVNAVLDLRTPDASLDALAAGLPIRVRHLSPYLVVISEA